MAVDGKIIIGTKVDDTGLKQGINGIEDAFGKLKSTLVGIGITTGLTVAIKEAVTSFSEFSSGLAKASTLFGDVAVDVDNLQSKILDMSNASGVATTSLTEGLYQALSAGVPVTEDMGEATEFLEKATKLSVSGFTDLPIAIEATAKTLNAYGMSVDEASRVQDILIMTQNKGITTVDELGRYLSQVTPIASAFGVSFEEVGASLALLTAKGTPTAQATTQLRQVIAELGKSGTQASKALKDASESAGLTETSFKGLLESGMGLDEILAMMKDYADQTGVSIIDLFSSIEAGQGALAITSDMERFRDNLDAMATSAGAVDDAYSKMTGTLDFQIGQTQTKLQNLKTVFGKELEAPMVEMVVFVNKVLDDMARLAPVASIAFTAVGQIADIVITAIKREYEDFKESFNKFLDFTGLDAVVELAFRPVGEFWDSLKSFVATGDVSYLLASATSALQIGTELFLVAGTIKGIIDIVSKGLALTGISGGTLAGAVLGIGLQFMLAQEEGDFQAFGDNLIAGIIAGAGVGILTKNPQMGALVATVVINLKLGSTIREIADDVFGATDAQTIADNITDPVAEALRNNTKLREASTDMMGLTWRELKKMAKEGGEGIGEFLAEGFGLGADDLDSVSREKAELILLAVNKTLGINSPSKEAKKQGEFYVQGFENGILTLPEAVAGVMQIALDEVNKALEDGAETTLDTVENIKAEIDKVLNPEGGSDTGKDDKDGLLKTLENQKSIASSVMDTFTSGIADTVTQLAQGEDAWSGFAKAGLNAIASIMDALSKQLSIQAVEALFAKDYALFAKMLAGSAGASAGAGLIRGWAGAFATGGIVKGAYTGGDNLTASVKAGEVILNHAQAINTARLLNAMETLAERGGGSGGIVVNFNGDVYGDKEEIARMVYAKTQTMLRDGRL